MYKTSLHYAIILIMALIVGACASKDTKPDGDQMSDSGSLNFDDDAASSGGPTVIPLDGDCQPPCELPRSALNDPASPIAQRVIFFDFDSSQIRSEYLDLLVQHGKYLASYPDIKIQLEGHTDERGSREYNMALGEERAKAVRQVLLLQGALAENISIVSFGEEMPMDLGHDEAAWAQNRRVKLVYQTQ